MIIDTIQCAHCLDIIFSRCRHDMRYCSCKRVAIDGGFDYIRLIGERLGYRALKIKLQTTKKELMMDWKLGNNLFGRIPVEPLRIVVCHHCSKMAEYFFPQIFCEYCFQIEVLKKELKECSKERRIDSLTRKLDFYQDLLEQNTALSEEERKIFKAKIHAAGEMLQKEQK